MPWYLTNWFIVPFALLMVGLLGGVMVLAVKQEQKSDEAAETEKYRRIAAAERAARAAKFPQHVRRV